MGLRKGGRAFWLLVPFSSVLFWLASPGDVGFWLLSCAAFVPLLFFVEKVVASKASRSLCLWGGMAHGLLLAVLMLYWIVNVLTHYGGLPVVGAGMALLLLGCYMACYSALFLVVLHFFLPLFSPLGLLFLLPSLWTGLEWVRGWAFTGFPWMDLGCYLAFEPWLLQGAAFFGHHGLTWLLVFCNVALWLLFSRRFQTDRLKIGVVSAVVVFVYVSVSCWILPQQRTVATETVRVGIVQGDVAQDMKWAAPQQQETVTTYLLASERLAATSQPPDFLVWPETAMPFYPQGNALTSQLRSFVTSRNIPLLSGAPWYEIVDREKQEIAYYNAAFLLVPDRFRPLGGVVFKSHLVPFGEYIPFQNLLPFLAPLVESAGNFTAGQISTPLQINTAHTVVQAGVLICFESVFPELSRKWAAASANLLINMTNDAWYGRTSAPKQTLAMTVLRAVETRRAVVRSANTGFSALILPTGEINARTGLFVPAATIVDAPLREEMTSYVVFGWLFAPLSLFFALGGMLLAMKKRKILVAKGKA